MNLGPVEEPVLVTAEPSPAPSAVLCSFMLLWTLGSFLSSWVMRCCLLQLPLGCWERFVLALGVPGPACRLGLCLITTVYVLAIVFVVCLRLYFGTVVLETKIQLC